LDLLRAAACGALYPKEAFMKIGKLVLAAVALAAALAMMGCPTAEGPAPSGAFAAQAEALEDSE